jgi:hypothetical protein
VGNFTVEDLMPYARIIAQAKTSQRGAGFGIVRRGESLMLIPDLGFDPRPIEALRRALEERGVKVLVLYDYELAGVSKADAEALRDAREAQRGEVAKWPLMQNGWMEGVGWWRGLGRNLEGVAWLKQKNPELYNKVFPHEEARKELSPRLQEIADNLQERMGQGAVKYMREHPEVRGVFQGGSAAGSLRYFAPLEDKWLGALTSYKDRHLFNDTSTFPDDLWILEEQLVMDPLAFVDKVTITDPEGTNFTFDVTPEQAAKWANGAYIRGHIFLSPDQVGGRYPFSFVDFPAEQDTFVPLDPRTKGNGVIAGTIGHTGFTPNMQLIYKDGVVVDVKGGGFYGDLFREALQYPGINELTYPFTEQPGYFHLFEIAMGTHPKYYRDPDNFVVPPPEWATGHDEIVRSGIFHLAVGANMFAEPGGYKGPPVNFWKWADEHKLPRGHGWHLHNYFMTYKVHVRNTDRWITITDKGHQVSLDTAEVRALASRYGDPDAVLAEEWVPEIPGINAPGKYEDYAKDPYAYARSVMDKVVAGTYQHLFPPLTAKPATR